MNLSTIRLVGSEFDIDDLRLERSKDYPRKIRLSVRVRHSKAIVRIDENGIKDEIHIDSKLGFYILKSRGHIIFEDVSGRNRVMVKCRADRVWNPDVKDLWFVSEPLTLEEISEIDEMLNRQDVHVSWEIECWGYLDRPENFGLMPGVLSLLTASSSKKFRLARQQFVRKILEPADMLRRLFLEVIVEPVNSREIDRIPDKDIRESLKILLNKQKSLQDALDALARASKSSDYKSVIETVRDVVEGLTQRDIVFKGLEKAFSYLGIVEAVDSAAFSEAIEELTGTLLGAKNSISKGIFDFSSIFKHTTTDKNKRHYTPRPYKHDAEFAVLQAMSFINYLVNVLKSASLRL